MKRNLLSVLLVTLLIFMVGCSSVTPKKVLQDAVLKSSKVDSYAFDFSVNFGMEPVSGEAVEAMQMLSFLEDIEISASGVHDEKQEKTEMVISVSLKGDMEFSLNIPVLLDGDELFIKLPNTPFFPLPEELQDKFIILSKSDLEEQGLTDSTEDLEQYKSFVTDLLKILLEDFGDTDFLALLKDEAVPASIKEAKNVVQIKVTNETLESFLTILYESTIPKVFELIEKPENLELLDLNSEEVAEIKSEFEQVSLEDDLAEIRDAFDLEEVSFTLGVNKEGYISNQIVNFAGVAKDEESGSIRLFLTVDGGTHNINKGQNFELNRPTEEQVVTLQEFMDGIFGGFFGSMDVKDDFYLDSDYSMGFDEDFDSNFDFGFGEDLDFEGEYYYDLGELEEVIEIHE